MTSEINIELLADLLKKKRGSRGLRDTADEISRSIGKISASTLSRIEQGKVPDLDTFIRLCRWLRIDTARVMSKTSSSAEDGLRKIDPNRRDKVTFHLRADQTLPKETAEALIKMVELAYDSETGKKG